MAIRIRLHSAMPLLVLAAAACGSSGAEPSTPSAAEPDAAPAAAQPIPGRRYEADPRALELIRRADEITYRPTAHGLRSVTCDAEFRTGGGMGDTATVFHAEYRLDAPGRSTVTLRRTEKGSGYAHAWDDGSSDELKTLLDDLFDGPNLERLVEGCELEMREEDGKPFVQAHRGPGETMETEYVDLRFAADGTLLQDGPGDRTVHPFCSARRRFAHKRVGDTYRRDRATYFDDAHGFELWTYDTVDGLLLPTKFARLVDGFPLEVRITNLRVNAAAASPGK